MTYRADDFYTHLLANNQPALSVQKSLNGTMPHAEWRVAALAAIRASFGCAPDTCMPTAPKLTGRAPCDGYMRYKFEYTACEGLIAPAYLLVPDHADVSTPCVLAAHGHGYGVKDIVGLMKDGREREGDPGYHKDFAASLCRRGMVVVAPELYGFGELRLQDDIVRDKSSSCFRLSLGLSMLGRSISQVRVTQCIRAVEAASCLIPFDLNRLGIMGISGGGLVALFTAVLDERFKAAVISGYACTFEDSVMAMDHCTDNFWFNLMDSLEMPDILSLVAPRPMLWECGTRDDIFPLHGVDKARAVTQAVYDHLNAGADFEVDIFPGEHQISGAKSYDFLMNRL